ncbi:hypothetical protein D3C78_1889620 [compost metagenome]
MVVVMVTALDWDWLLLKASPLTTYFTPGRLGTLMVWLLPVAWATSTEPETPKSRKIEVCTVSSAPRLV